VNFHELARKQLADYDRHRPGAIFANNAVTMTIDQAYELQTEVARLRQARGEPLAGYKVGCISPAMQAQLGIGQPVFGHVYATELHSSGVMLDPKRFDGLAIEGEFAVRLAADIPDAAWLRVHPREAIASAFAVIELHNFVFRNSPHTAPELIGNNAIHAGVILPLRETALESPDELLDAAIVVSKNGRELGTATGRALPEGPYGSLLQLADHLARFGRRLRRDQIILTGSPLPLYPVTDGDFLAVLSNRSETVTATVSRRVATG
jgi:2-keto-4-pentenoate hydratase